MKFWDTIKGRRVIELEQKIVQLEQDIELKRAEIKEHVKAVQLAQKKMIGEREIREALAYVVEKFARQDLLPIYCWCSLAEHTALCKNAGAALTKSKETDAREG